MEETIERILYPNEGKLEKDSEGTLKTIIVDAELDGIECTFNNDDCVTLNTEDLKYIVLTVENLHNLIDLIEEAQEIYSDEHSK